MLLDFFLTEHLKIFYVLSYLHYKKGQTLHFKLIPSLTILDFHGDDIMS